MWICPIVAAGGILVMTVSGSQELRTTSPRSRWEAEHRRASAAANRGEEEIPLADDGVSSGRRPRPSRADTARGLRGQPRRGGAGRAVRSGAGGWPRSRAAARDPDPPEGQHRHRGSDDHHRRIHGPSRLDAATGRIPRDEAARRGCRVARQDQHERVGRLEIVRPRDDRMEWARMGRGPRRAVPKPVRAGPLTRRVQLRIGRSVRSKLHRGCRRY